MLWALLPDLNKYDTLFFH